MYRTVDLLNRVKAAYNLTSDYSLAKKLDVSKQAVSRYYNSGYVLDDRIAFQVCDLLDLDHAQIVACMHVERAERKHDESLKSFWMQYAA